MHLTKQEKQNLIDPLVVGILFGLLAAIGVFVFLSEYGPNIHASSVWSLITIEATQAFVTFVIVVGSCVLLFGAVPIGISRVLSRKRKASHNA